MSPPQPAVGRHLGGRRRSAPLAKNQYLVTGPLRLNSIVPLHYCVLLSACLPLLLSVRQASSVIMPPRLHHQDHPLGADQHRVHEDVPQYLLSINEGSDLPIGINSSAAITVNLNRALRQDVTVVITVQSGPNLIEFEPSKGNNASSPGTEVVYRADTFGDRVVQFHTNAAAGHAEIVCKILKQPANITIDDSQAYISIDIYRNANLNVLIQIVGWIYFFAWSASFYFQVVLNYQRKSVVGLNFDFLALNLLGFTCYSIYNFSFMFSHDVQREYYQRYAYSRIPVEYNDLFFSLHAFALTLITVVQCFMYERGGQRLSLPAGILATVVVLFGLGLYTSQLFSAIKILSVVLYLSYVKLVITIIKYAPQAYMNYRRKATTGWSIHNILLDFTGGVFSLAQMFFLAYNYDDWISIFGNFTKFGLGVVSMAFDILFVIQHYVVYGQRRVNLDESGEDSIPSPVISQSIRSTSGPGPLAAGARNGALDNDAEAEAEDDDDDDDDDEANGARRAAKTTSEREAN